MSSAKEFQILIVDDVESNRLQLEAILGDSYAIVHAADGEECLEIVQSDPPSLILLDVNMPGMDGYAVCRKIKSCPESYDIPIIFVSILISPEEKLAGFEAGGDEYVTKPVAEEDLLEKIQGSLHAVAETKKIRDAATHAMSVAMEAMVSSSELGTLNQFLRDCALANSYQELAEALFVATQSFGLHCSLQFRLDVGLKNYACEDDSLDARLLEKSDHAEKITDMGHRTVVTVPTAGILVKNMPLDEPEKYGRLRDHLSVLIDSIAIKLDSLMLMKSIEIQREQLVAELIDQNSLQLRRIQTRIHELDSERREIMLSLLNGVEDQLFSLGLEEDQENHLIGLLDQGIQKVDRLPGFEAEIAASFALADDQLKKLLGTRA